MHTVVLVDDEQIILQGLLRVFPWGEFGCRVAGTAGDGAQGAALVREARPNILFTDIRMPNLDGLAMVAALKSEFPRLQIAVLTAFRDFDYAREAIRLGVCRYLLKPSKMEELREAVGFMTAALEAPAAGGDACAAPEANEAAGCFVLKAALDYLEKHCCERLTLSDLAARVYVSQWHLSKLIHKFEKMSFFEVLNRLRVRKAMELLRDPALKVHEVADRVGFSDAAHFSKCFRRAAGCSPAAYRARL